VSSSSALYAEDTWQFQTVDSISSGVVPRDASLAIDGQGRVHIVYSYIGALKYGVQTPCGWQIETVDSPGDDIDNVFLALDGGGAAHISYANLTESTLKYASQTASGWQIQTVETGVPVYDHFLALDGNGRAHIAYQIQSHTLKYAAQTETNWFIETVASLGHEGGSSSLAIDRDGQVHLTYYNGTDATLYYGVRTASGWQIEAVPGTQGGLIERYGWLALDQSGRAHIAYQLYPSGGVQYASQTATGWQIETADGTSGAGYRTCLALDGYDQPHICSAGPNWALVYLTKSASGWQREPIGDVGNPNSMALDGDGHPHISYWSGRSGSVLLRYATRAPTSTNVPPTVEAGADAVIGEGDTFTSSGSFSDPDPDTWVATVDYGDGTGVQPLSLNPDKTFSLGHVYCDDGEYAVTVTVTDDHGCVGSDSAAVTVNSVAPTPSIGGQGFVEEFNAPTVDPAWQVVAFIGPRVYGYTSPANHISLTDRPGYLRYYLDPMTHCYGFINGFQTSGGYDPGLELRRSFSGDNWTFETKVQYYMPYSNGRAEQIVIYFGDGVANTFAVGFYRARDDGYGSNYVQFYLTNWPAFLGPGYDLESVVVDVAANPADTWFYRATRTDGVLTVMWSADGIAWNPVFSRDMGTQLDDLAQTVVIVGHSWFYPAGSYADYDYVQVVAGASSFAIDEGSTFVGPGSFADPGCDTWTATVDYGDGSGAQPLPLNPDKTFTLSHVYCDDGDYTVTVTVTDDDGGVGTDTATVTVQNVKPLVNAGDDATIMEGDTFSGLGSFTDPGADTWTAMVDYGDGSGEQPLTLNADKTFALSHVYADNGTYTVAVIVTDDDGGVGNDTVVVTVNNVEPTVTSLSVSPAAANENDTVMLTGAFTDPGILDTHTAEINWGDGSPVTTINLDAGVLSFAVAHQYLDDNPTGTSSDVNVIQVVIKDKDEGSGMGNTSVTINNVPPTVSAIAAPLDPHQVGSTINASTTFADVGTQDTHTVVWDWGDGTASAGAVEEANGSGSASGSHAYTVAGVYTVKLTVTDDDGGEGESTFQYVVIYDPEGGFVTGGGWINSPAGAYAPDPSLSGKATFGFVSKYKKGASVPTGNTEFQFKVANLNFHSESYEWLVIAGAKAQYKGTGTINGAGEYRFKLTAIDGQINGGGGVDKFRIRIWSDGGGLVYDNQMSAPDDADPTTAIAGGSIVIHKQ